MLKQSNRINPQLLKQVTIVQNKRDADAELNNTKVFNETPEKCLERFKRVQSIVNHLTETLQMS